MNKRHFLPSAICRYIYLLAVYSGLRAAANYARSWNCGQAPQAALLNGTTTSTVATGPLTLSVNTRPPPISASRAVSYGIISIRQQKPSISAWLYRYLCLTSHFGRGHVEIAFYETADTVTFYAIRNIAKSNASRLRLYGTASQLSFAKRREDRIVLRHVSRLLESKGIQPKIADPHECVALSVNEWLLPPDSQSTTLKTLARKYEKLQVALKPT
jgi:hypothetical protein